MNQPNPLEPQGSLLERAAQSRSRLKLAVFTSIGISVVGLTAMLLGGQGCKREEPVPPPVPVDTIPLPAFDPGTNTPLDTNVTTTTTTTNPIPNYGAPPVPVVVTPPPPVVPEPAVGQHDYVIQKGDTFATVAKKQGVSVKAIQQANPGVDPRKLKINQKIVIPAATAPAAAPTSGSTTAPAPTGSEASYVVQSGDSLTKIAKKHGVSVPALRKANHLTTDRIKVNQKLVIPAKPPGAAPVETAPVPAPAPMTAPAGGVPPA